MEWQPIETAPGTEEIILLWGGGVNQAVVGFRNLGTWDFTFWDGTVQWLEVCQDDYGELRAWTKGYSPTHWMPLPSPPSAA